MDLMLLWLDDNIPDLIISDIQMEKMDGYEFLTKLRQRGFTKHTLHHVIRKIRK
jgi:CheY-like chemotaxis protein